MNDSGYKSIVIVGGGFSGTMTAVQLIENASLPFELSIVNEEISFHRGIAYNAYSLRHLLNVTAKKMSAFPDNPEHLVDWLIKKGEYDTLTKEQIGELFLPRKLYGAYLSDIWNEAKTKAEAKGIKTRLVISKATDLEITNNDRIRLWLNDIDNIECDECILATGNQVPGNIPIKNLSFFDSKNYFQDPWQKQSVTSIDPDIPVLIIGNGLTMADTVLAIQEQGFEGIIYSISPHGFNLIPHINHPFIYTEFIHEISPGISLLEMIRLVNKHRKFLALKNIPTEVLIDSLRPYTQDIWKGFTDIEKKIFIKRLSHLWNTARHRIPSETFNIISSLRKKGKLVTISGKIQDFEEKNNVVTVKYIDSTLGSKQIEVSRVINCSGPNTDILRSGNSLLINCFEKGIIIQDPLKLGFETDTHTFQMWNNDKKINKHLYTIGSNLKGNLWESTAVNELRSQAKKLALQLLKK